MRLLVWFREVQEMAPQPSLPEYPNQRNVNYKNPAGDMDICRSLVSVECFQVEITAPYRACVCVVGVCVCGCFVKCDDTQQ
jgi:hypothetical protein